MSKEPNTCPSYKTMIGGQALIEGIMMLGPTRKATVCRKSDGEMVMEVSERTLIKDRWPVLGIPFLRGVVNFLSSMVNGVKALMWSADCYAEEDGPAEEPSRFEVWLEKTLGGEKAVSALTTLAVVLGITFSILLFLVLPTLLTGGILYFFPDFPLWGRNLMEGAAKVLIFVLYLYLSSKMKDIRRTFQYHGAEHKTIFCYEQGLELTVENVRKMPRHHPRCGTSFLFVVIFLSILISSLVFSFFPVVNPFLRAGMHLLMLPLVVSLTYELNRYVGGHDNLLCRAIRAPGMWMQNFTTFEPDDTMIEVGIAAFQAVLPEKKGSDAW